MSYLDEYNEIEKNIEEARFNETAEYLVDHYEYANSVARTQSETSKAKLSGALVGILSDDQYQQTLVKYDENETVVLFKKTTTNLDKILLDISGTDAMRIPAGTTAQRPANVRDGYMRMNTTTNYLEVYNNGSWGSLLKSDQADAYIENYVDGYIDDISRNLNDKINRDISNVIGGASESLDTLLELENYVTDLSEGKIGKAITDILDISGRETAHYNQLSNEIIDLSNDSVREQSILDLSSTTFDTIDTEISTLSNETFTTIASLSSETFASISTVKSLTSIEITDLSNYTSGELSMEIRDLSSFIINDTNTKITDLSNYTSTELTRQILDLSTLAFSEIDTKQDILTNGDVTNNLLANSSLSLGGVTIALGDTNATPVFDLTNAINYPTSSLVGTIDLTSQVSNILPAANGGTSWQTTISGLRYNGGIGINVDPLSYATLYTSRGKNITIFESSDAAYDTIFALRNSSGASNEWSLTIDATNNSGDAFRIKQYTTETFRIDSSTKNVNIGSSYNNSNPYKLNVEGTVNSTGKITALEIETPDISANAMDLATLNVSSILLNSTDVNSTFETISNVTIISQEIVDLSGYTSTELSREIADITNENSVEISTVKSLTSSEITDLSNYTSTELSRQITDLSNETVSDIADLSSLTFHTIATEITDLSNYTSSELTSQSLLTSSEITDLSNYTSTELTRQITSLSNETVSDIADLSSLTFHTITTEITDLSNYTSSELIRQSLLTSSEITDLSNYTSTELTRQITSLSNETVSDIADLSSLTFHTIATEITDLSNYTSSELTRQSLLTSSEITDLSNYTSSELTRQSLLTSSEITDLSNYTSSELTQKITDLSNYTSTELSRQISDLSNETVSDIADLSSITFQTIATEITDLSNYTSSELTRQITSLSNETVSDIADLSSLTFQTIATEITDLSNYTSSELKLLSTITSNEISDLSSFTSRELYRKVRDLSNATTLFLNLERNTTNNQITDLSNYTSSELTRQITDLSSESVRDISDLSSLAFNTIHTRVTDLSNSTTTLLSLERSTTNTQISDLSNYTSTELTRQISIERSTNVRDLSDMSGDIHHIIDELIGNAPHYLDTLEEIAFVLGDVTEPSGGIGTIIEKIYSVSQDIYDLSQTVAGVDGDFRNLNGRLTVNAYSDANPTEDIAIEAIDGDISLNKAIRLHNNHNIILGNASTGDTIASSSTGNILIGSGTDISNANISYATGIGHAIDLSGSGSTGLGYLAKTNGQNATAIGYNSFADGDNVIQLGNTQVEFVNTNGVVTMSSDSRLKANVETIPCALEKVCALRGVTYTRTDLPNKEKVYMGLIAQETEKVVPEVVNNNGQYKSVMYNNLMGLLVEAVKDLDNNHKILDLKQNNFEKELTSIRTVIREKLRKLNSIKNLLDVREENKYRK